MLRLRGVGSHYVYRDSVYSERFCVGARLQGCPPPIPSLSFHCLTSVTGACPPFMWGLMAGLPGFASHGSGLYLGAGCQ